MRERKVSLYVYGVIHYLDTLRGEEHKTCFCELYWVPEKDFNEPEGFMFPANLIPEAYICAS
jgi:ferredoxin-thioredoxin reductase catalytic subunit